MSSADRLWAVVPVKQFAGAKQRHGVDDHRARLGRSQPSGDQRRIIARTDQHAVAGLDAVILHQRMRQPVGPVRQFLVGALAAVANERDIVAEPLLDDAVGQLDRRIEILRILKLRPVEQQLRPLPRWRQVSPRKIVDVTRRTECGNFTCHRIALSFGRKGLFGSILYLK